MKVVSNTVFHLLNSDYIFRKESKSAEKLIAEVRKLAKSAEENMEPSFIYHIRAVKCCGLVDTGCSRITGKRIFNEVYKQAPFATLCYTSDGELTIDYHFNFE